jgi:hypothetical protein
MAAPNIAPLADALLALPSGEQDITDVYDALAPLLPHDAFVELGHALELCPVHRCDERICADDRADCPAGVGGLTATEKTDAELAHALRVADENDGDTVELVNEVASRLGLDPSETEQGPTEKAVREIDAFIDRHDPVR